MEEVFSMESSKWWLNLNSQPSPSHPCVKHKATAEPLWMDSWGNPLWVHGDLSGQGFTRPLCQDTFSTTQIHSFVASLRTCSRNKDLVRGISIHNELVERFLLEKCLNALVTMYAKCGELQKAKSLLDTHKSGDVITWTALIAGYAREGQGQTALDCFEQMQSEGILPNATTYVCALKACALIRALDRGKQIHDDIGRQGLLHSNIVLCGALVDMYAKCRAVTAARRVLEGLPSRNVVVWNVMIAACAQEGEAEQALNCLEEMQHEGILPNATTYYCALKACASIRASERGKQIHDKIARQGLLENDIVLGNALVDMYGKCGDVSEARQVLEGLPSRDVVSWNALVTGYAQEGEAEQALDCLEQMQHEGIPPNDVTYISALRACGKIRAADRGKQIHDEIMRQGLLQNNVVLGGALVDMYAKCRAISEARRVLEELPSQNVVSWNALITGYLEEGETEQALNSLEEMQHGGILPDAVTYVCTLKACALIRAAERGEEIHTKLAKQGLQIGIALGNALVDMYAKCGNVFEARWVLDELVSRDVFSWNALITAHAQEGEAEQALNCLEQMQQEGIPPNAVTYVCALKACAKTRAVDRGKQIHHEIVRQGLLQKNIVLGGALVDMYAKCGAILDARWVLEELPSRNVLSWNAMIAGYAEEGEAGHALNCLEQMQHEGIPPNSVTYVCTLKACAMIRASGKGKQIHGEIVRQGLLQHDIMLGNALVDMYAKCGNVSEAQWVLEELPSQDVVSWNALIAGYVQKGEAEQALNCLEQMQHEGILPDSVTYICALKACAMIRAADKGKQVHDAIVRQELLQNDMVLGGALVDMYAKCGAISEARWVLKESASRNVISWSALIAGFVEEGEGKHALICFEEMQHEGILPDAVTYICILKACALIQSLGSGKQIHDEITRQGLLQKDVVLAGALVDMYAKCGDVAKAREVLEELPSRNVISWNALIAGYAQEGAAEQALNCLEQMQNEGILPDAATYVCALKACAMIRAADIGKQIHSEIARQGLLQDGIVLGGALVDMYAKCGDVSEAQQVLEELPSRDVVSWNALIGGYAQEGEAEQALNCLEQMQHEGILPDAVTCVCVLNVCSHRGLVEEGQALFMRMSSQYGVTPTLEGYTCMIDLLGRAGHLAKAVRLIQEIPSSNYTATWHALLGACWKWTDVNVGEWAFEQAVKLDRSDGPAHVLMANIYAAAGMEEKAKSIEAMRIRIEGWKKQGGSPWIDSSNIVHGCSAVNAKHGPSELSDAKLDDVCCKMSQQGYS